MKRTSVAKWSDKKQYWQINVQKGGVRKSFYSSKPGRQGQRECHAKADDWLDDNITDSSIRVNILWEEYLTSQKESTSKSNWIKVESFGKNWIKPVIGSKKICELSEANLQQIINKAYAKGLAKKTLTNLKATITSFIKYCRMRNVTKLFPENVRIPKGAKTSQKRILQPNDLVTLFSVDTTTKYNKRIKDPLINAYRLQVLTGLRPGELLGLEWTDIVENKVHVRRSINKYGEVTTGKNDNAVRHFVLSGLALKVLTDQRKLSLTKGRIFGDITHDIYRKRWEKYCISNGIELISTYELRHTFVSVAKNLSEGQVKTLVGHSKNMDTFGIYGHELQGELEETANEIDELFSRLIGE
ncbi:site-specific integrase [Intestinibacillus massiliensis]|nr:site-specific integrase [Intestinibacillus massiliensis]